MTSVSSCVITSFLALPRCAGVTLSMPRPSSSLTSVAPVAAAMSSSIALRWSPKPGAFAAASGSPRSLFSTSVVSASPSMFSHTIASGRCVRAACSSSGTSSCALVSRLSVSSSSGFAKSHVCRFVSVIKYRLTNPLSNFIPSAISSSSLNVLPSCTVITPSLPTFSTADAISAPIAASLFALTVATCRISSDVRTFRDSCCSWPTTSRTASSIPSRRSIGFIPAATARTPSANMCRASTVAVVVPSPASSFVFDATPFTSCAPTFIRWSVNSMCRATVTPSFVIFGAP